MFKDVGKTNVWADNLSGALQDKAKLEAWGLDSDAQKSIIETLQDQNRKPEDRNQAALRIFKEASKAREDKSAKGLTEWEFNLFNRAEKDDETTQFDDKFEAEFNRAILEEGFDNWYDSETAKRGAPPSDVEARQWVGDKTRAVIQGAGAANLFKTSGLVPPASSVPAGTLSIRGFQEVPTLAEKLPEGLAPYADTFIEAARENGLNPAVLAAISMHETANGTSKAFKEKNNAMGISDSSGPTTQESVEASIKRMARYLAGKTYAKASTLEEIGKIYAPVGAGNDPKKLNSYWPGGVASHYAKLIQ